MKLTVGSKTVALSGLNVKSADGIGETQTISTTVAVLEHPFPSVVVNVIS